MNKKTFIINGKSLTLSEIKSKKDSSYKRIYNFLSVFYDDSSHIAISTSGSTGKPQEIGIKKEHMIASASKTIEFLKLEKGIRILNCLPTNKIAGLMMLVRWLVGDFDLVLIEPSGNPLKEVEGNFDFAAMIPLQAHNSLNELNRINKLIIGGGVIDKDLEDLLEGISCKIYHTYGMTETISHVAMRPIGQDMVFQALSNVKFSKNSNSCLTINAPDIGVSDLVTNDVVHLLSESSFSWLGRLDNVVNSAGIKLYPEEIEKKLGDIGSNYFLAGMSDVKLGQKLIIVVEGEEPPKIWDKIAQLDLYERPKELLIVKEFSRTSTGKIIRMESLERFFSDTNN